MDTTFTTFEQMLLNGDGIVGNDTTDSTGNATNGDASRTSHLGDLTGTTRSEDPDSAEDVVANLLKEHRRQHGEDDDDDDDLHDNDDDDDETRQHREQHRELVRQLTSSVVAANILMKQQDDDITSVVNRQLSSSFGDGPDYETAHHNLDNLNHHDESTTNDRSVHDNNNGVNIQLHHEEQDEDDDDAELSNPPMICRICHKMDGRPVLRFPPVEYDMNVVAAAPHVQTFPLDICLHVFCGKTASILPNINKPEYEILTKAGIKNKHGIGGEVNAALSRTRCATLPTEANTGKEKQFYLVREFEAHLSAVRGYIQTNQQQQQQMLLHQNHFNRSTPITSAPVRNSISSSIIHPSKNNPYIQPPQQSQPHPASAISSSVTASQIMTNLSSPTNSSNHQYSHLLQNLNGNGMNHSMNNNNNMLTSALTGNGSGTLMSTPSGQSPQHQLQTQHQQQPVLSTLLLNFNGDNNTANALDHLYSSANNGSDVMNINSNNNGSPTLEQLESMLRQQQQIQLQQQSSVAASSFVASNSNNNNYTSSTTNSKKKIPIKAGNLSSKYQPPQGTTSSNNNGRVPCECGGTYLPTHTTKGVASYKNHIATKRHQKYLSDQEHVRLQQILAGNFSSNTNLYSSNNNNLLYNPTHPLFVSSTTSTSGQQNQFNSILESINNNSNHSHVMDNGNGGSSSTNSSVYGAAV
jgi:hypothetical protein